VLVSSTSKYSKGELYLKNIIFITSRLDKDHGGLTASLLNKARILYDYENIKSKVLTFHADHNFRETSAEIKQRYDLEGKVDIINLNDFFRTQCSNRDKKQYDVDTDGLISVKVNDNKMEYYHEGLKKLEVTYKNDLIHEVKHFSDNSICVKKNIIDKDGYLYWTSYYFDNKLSRQVFYKLDKTPIVTREYDATSNKQKIKNVVLFKDTPIRFGNFDEFKEYFIKQFITDDYTYLVGEARALDPNIMNITDARVRKIFMTHSIHLRPGTDVIRLGNRQVLNNLNDIDALVLLTQQQRQDIIDRFGYRNNYYVIPHSIKISEISQKRTRDKVVLISRLHEEKRLDHAIKAFKQVVKAKPEATLLIYGDGDERTKLQNLINKLGLQEHVKLMGYSSDVDEILQTAACSILTSQYEGFALVIQESIANGTPVIAYDIKYGPSDMIDHGVNGYLAENGDIEDLASSIINYLNKSTSEQQKFSAAAIEKASQFSNENFAKSWVKLFEQTEENKTVFKPEAKLININQKKINKNKYKIDIKVKLNAEKNVQPEFIGVFYHRSTLENNKISKCDCVDTKVTQLEGDLFKIEVPFHADKYKKKEIYDLSLEVKDESQYHNIRIGNQRESFNIQNLATRKVKPYYTKNHDNLSFKL
jgi:glycosyltransferase involved in cell wall biosynthesis